jgi:hypothetical protein
MRVTSEGPTKITKATIDAAWKRRKSEHRLVMRDRDCRGLALVVNATTMRWEYGFRPRGTDPVAGRRHPNRTVTIGNPGSHSPDDARSEANRIKGSATAGGDPATERKAKAEAAQHARGSTFERLAEQYGKALPHRPKMSGTGLPSADYVKAELVQVRFALAAVEAKRPCQPGI